MCSYGVTATKRIINATSYNNQQSIKRLVYLEMNRTMLVMTSKYTNYRFTIKGLKNSQL